MKNTESVNQQKIVLQYLEDSYTGARMLDDEESMLRLARAIAAFKASLDKDIFNQEFETEYYSTVE